jgi:hypothetical protein
VLGFEDFLDHVEAERFNRVIKTPEMFEKFLPYAMALNVEKNWSRAFQDIYREPPSWYVGSYGPSFYSSGFARSLNNVQPCGQRYAIGAAQLRRLRIWRWWRWIWWRRRSWVLARQTNLAAIADPAVLMTLDFRLKDFTRFVVMFFLYSN